MIYIAGVSCIQEIDNLCPECIKSGQAYKKFNCKFNNYIDLINCGANKEQAEIVAYKTPGILKANEFSWPIQNGVPGIYQGIKSSEAAVLKGHDKEIDLPEGMKPSSNVEFHTFIMQDGEERVIISYT